jgi:hypothetical protein
MNPQTVLMIGGGLGLLLLVVGLAMTFLGERSIVEERLGRYAEGQVVSTSVDEAKKQRGSIIADYLERAGEGSELFSNLSRDLARADLKLRPAEYIAVIVISIVAFGVIGFIISSSMIFAVVGMILGAQLDGEWLTSWVLNSPGDGSRQPRTSKTD